MVVTGPEAEPLDAWLSCVVASVRHARDRGLLGGAGVTVGHRSGSPVALASFEPGDRERQWLDIWQVQEFGPEVSWAECHNQLFERADTPELVLLVEPTTYVSPTCISELIGSLRDPGVGIVEARRLPVESPKPYELQLGETSWASSACCLIRRDVLAATHGYDVENFPGAGSDIDLSWRARLAGWAIRYSPWATFIVRAAPMSAQPEHAELEHAKLRLMSKYSGSSLARAWSLAWKDRGTAAQQQAAALFEQSTEHTVAPNGQVPNFVSDLFGLEPFADAKWESDGMPQIQAGRSDCGVTDHQTTVVGAPFLTVVVRTQGQRLATLEDNLLSLAAQTCQDFEVLVVCHNVLPDDAVGVSAVIDTFPLSMASRIRRIDVSGGGRSRPLNVGVTEAHGRYVAFLDDDDVAFGRWVEMFHRVASSHPQAVGWTQVAWQPVDQVICADRAAWRTAAPQTIFAAEFDLFSHLCQNGTPNCGLAIPTACFREEGLHFREDLDVLEDWDMLLQVAQLRPIRSTGCRTALYRRGMSGNSGEMHPFGDWERAADIVLGALDATSFVLRGEYLPAFRDAMEELDNLRWEDEGGDYDDDYDDDEEESDDATDADPLTGDGAPLKAERPAEVSWSQVPPVDQKGRLAARRVLVISPHLDDAVLSCGDLIWQVPGCAVLTVFAGDDVDWSELRAWDEMAGFAIGADVVAARVSEDDNALHSLGARGERLSFLEDQYRDSGITPSSEVLSEAIEAVLFPIGLGHVDHQLVAAGALRAVRALPDLDWFAYLDLPYGYEWAEGVQDALAALAEVKPTPVQLSASSDVARKSAALDFYASQMAALGVRRVSALQAERFWALSPAAPQLGDSPDHGVVVDGGFPPADDAT